MSKNKVSVFEKMGLVRSIEQPTKMPVITEENVLFEEEDLPVVADSLTYEIDPSQLLQIETIYEQVGLSATDESIFKVAEIAGSLPEELTSRQKKEITLKLLNTMHLDWNTVSSDGQRRVSVLLETERKFNQESDEHLVSLKNQIKSLENQIDALKEQVLLTQKQTEAETNLIEAEMDKVNALLLFINDGSEQL